MTSQQTSSHTTPVTASEMTPELAEPWVLNTELPRLKVAMDVDLTLAAMIEYPRPTIGETLESVGLTHERKTIWGSPIVDCLRPKAREFLQELSTFADVVLYTHRMDVAADSGRDLLDADHTFVKEVFSRKHTFYFLDIASKDLHLLAPSLERVVLVDDNWHLVGRSHLTNCLPIQSWPADDAMRRKDKERLAELAEDNYLFEHTLPMLKKLANAPDVRVLLAEHLRDPVYRDQVPPEPLTHDPSTTRNRERLLHNFGCGLTSEDFSLIADETFTYAQACLDHIDNKPLQHETKKRNGHENELTDGNSSSSSNPKKRKTETQDDSAGTNA